MPDQTQAPTTDPTVAALAAAASALRAAADFGGHSNDPDVPGRVAVMVDVMEQVDRVASSLRVDADLNGLPVDALDDLAYSLLNAHAHADRAHGEMTRAR